MRKNSSCKHNFVECLITYHYKTLIAHDPFEIVRHTEYCTKCGCVNNKRFDEDLYKKRLADSDRYGLAVISADELREKYKDLPAFDLLEGETNVFAK
jgi:hypothetical protein